MERRPCAARRDRTSVLRRTGSRRDRPALVGDKPTHLAGQDPPAWEEYAAAVEFPGGTTLPRPGPPEIRPSPGWEKRSPQPPHSRFLREAGCSRSCFEPAG